MRLCMKWRDMVHGCMAYAERAEMAAVSRGTSHVTVKQRCKHTTSVDIQKCAIKSYSLMQNHMRAAVGLLESGE